MKTFFNIALSGSAVGVALATSSCEECIQPVEAVFENATIFPNLGELCKAVNEAKTCAGTNLTCVESDPEKAEVLAFCEDECAPCLTEPFENVMEKIENLGLDDPENGGEDALNALSELLTAACEIKDEVDECTADKTCSDDFNSFLEGALSDQEGDESLEEACEGIGCLTCAFDFLASAEQLAQGGEAETCTAILTLDSCTKAAGCSLEDALTGNRRVLSTAGRRLSSIPFARDLQDDPVEAYQQLINDCNAKGYGSPAPKATASVFLALAAPFALLFK